MKDVGSQNNTPAPPKHWLNRNILGMGLASLFSDMNHEMATAVLPIFLSSVLGAPAFALGVIEGIADGVSTFFEVWSGWYSDSNKPERHRVAARSLQLAVRKHPRPIPKTASSARG